MGTTPFFAPPPVKVEKTPEEEKLEADQYVVNAPEHVRNPWKEAPGDVGSTNNNLLKPEKGLG